MLPIDCRKEEREDLTHSNGACDEAHGGFFGDLRRRLDVRSLVGRRRHCLFVSVCVYY